MNEKTKGMQVPEAVVDVLAAQFRPHIQELAQGIVQGLTKRLTVELSAALSAPGALQVEPQQAQPATVVTTPAVPTQLCSVNSCASAARSKGLCAKHYQARRRVAAKKAAKKAAAEK